MILCKMKYFVFFCYMFSACGRVLHAGHSELSNYMVGGQDTTIDQHPYHLAVEMGGHHHCSASIISKNWALTAAHCFYMPFPSEYKIRAGTSFLNEGGQVYVVKELIIHEDFNYTSGDNDIALMQILGDFDIGNTQTIISLPEQGMNFGHGAMAVVTGWGLTSENGNYSYILQEISVPFVSKKMCQKLHIDKNITDKMLCAGYPKGGGDSCLGDSGGPLVKNAHQFGIVSLGKGCANAGSPSIYTRVAAFRQWISRNIDV